jgi:hypothetical protein
MLPFTVPIAYLIHQPDSPPIELTAAKVNLGINRLWFFDEQSNLLAVFRWEKISGLSVKGSAENQVIDGLPDNMQKVTSDAELEAEKGAVLAALETAHQALDRAKSQLSTAWLRLLDAIRQSPTESALLVTRREGELLLQEARLLDSAAGVEKSAQHIIGELRSLLDSGKQKK